MVNSNIVSYLKKNICNGGYVLLDKTQYNGLTSKYDFDDIVDSFIYVFMLNRSKKSVFKTIHSDDVEKKILKLRKKEANTINIDNIKIMMKHKYDFNVGDCLALTQLGHYYNDISNYFHLDNRMKCGGYNRVSPHEIWNGVNLDDDTWKQLLKGFISPLFRSVNDKKQITEHEYRFCFRLSSTVYAAPQFKPETAKTIIEMFSKNGNILDFSCGWGDRLAGFFASNNGKFYLGTDPNISLHDGYNNQIKTYSKYVNDKDSIILNQPAEDVNWLVYKNKMVDLIFTSPPYFNTEYYAKNTEYETNQSWHRYNNYTSWRDSFLLKTLKDTTKILINDGIVAINIIDITINGKTYNICEDIYNFMINNGFVYLGYVGMRMKQRPKNIDGDNNKKYMSSYYVEPIWIYKKNNITIKQK